MRVSPRKLNRSKDPLTGVYSRAAINDWLQREMERSRQRRQPVSLLMLDLDHFKSINDAFGHGRGDQALANFAQQLSSLIRNSDVLFRYGGDEFLLLLPHTDKRQSALLAQRLLDAVRATPIPGQPPFYLSISIGVASYPEDSQIAENLFEIADRRHYQAKRAGRGLVVSQDIDRPASSPFHEIPRLIERDYALDSLHRFLNALQQQQAGVLQVAGPPGAGKSYFLNEIRKAGWLQGYIVLPLNGTPALKSRLYGAIDEAQWEGEHLPLASMGIEPFAAALRQELSDKGQVGVIITVDNLHDIDQASMAFLRELLFSARLPQLAVAYASRTASAPRDLFPGIHLAETLNLSPISLTGLQVWLRHSLQWEAPLPFIEWLYRQTGGLPESIQTALNHLVAGQLIKPAAGSWSYPPGLTNLSISEQISRRSSPPPTNLPGSLPDFVGREADLRQLKHLIQDQRLVTLVGPGGIGKTRLAVQACAESLEMFADGVYYVPLSAADQANFIVAAIAEALKFTFSGSKDPQAQLQQYLRSRELLLLLDNFMSSREGLNLVENLLNHAPRVKLLVTSRERLNLPGERPVGLRGLEYPKEEAVTGWTTALEEPAQPRRSLTTYSAVQLFLHSARQIQPEYALAEGDYPHLARICHLVDGMPLGLELAAAWIKAFTCQEIAAEIEHNLNFLDADRREQHSSLQAAFDYLWSLLSEGEQIVLSKLSVFRGGFERQAAQFVARASLFFLDSLETKFFLYKTFQGRYQLHELLRQYAAEKLDELSEEFLQARGRHCEYYLDFLQSHRAALSQSKAGVTAITTEIENIRSAWEWATTQALTAPISASLDSLATFYYMSGLFQEAEAALGTAAAHLKTLLSDPTLETQARGEIQGAAAGLLAQLAVFANARSRFGDTAAYTQEAIQLATVAGDNAAKAMAYLQWGRACWRQGDNFEARHLIETALHLARQVHTPALEADCLNNLGVVDGNQGNYSLAAEKHELACSLFEQLGDRRGEALAMNNLGVIMNNLGEWLKAKRFYEQALVIFRDIGDRVLESVCLNNLGTITSETGDYTTALAYYRQSLLMDQSIGDRRGENLSLNNLGAVYHELGDYANAQAYYEQCLAISREIGDLHGENLAVGNLSMLNHHTGQPQQALELGQRALRISLDTGNVSYRGYADHCIGHALFDLERFEEAAEAYRQAASIRRELGEQHLAIESLAGLARTDLARHALAEASADVEEVLAFLESNGLEGTEEPMRIYLTCWQVLEAAGDERATATLEKAHARLHEKAARISDLVLRASFLENVPAHATLEQAWKQISAS